MSLLAQRRAFISAYRETGSIEAAAAKLGLDPGIHEEWSKDWLYRGAFAETVKEMKLEAEGKLPPPPPPKRPPGRPKKVLAGPPPPKRPRGRPRLNPPVEASNPVEKREVSAESPQEPLPLSAEPAPEPSEAPPPPPEPPKLEEHVFEGRKGYVKLYTAPGETPEPPAEPEKPKREVQEPSPEPVIDLAVQTDATQKSMLDELGELDRKFKLRSLDSQRFESLKKAVRAWFDELPNDCDGVAEGNVFLVHLSARERERKVRDNAEIAALIGIEKFYQIARINLADLENLLGKAQVEALTVETRSGTRRIRCLPKYPAALPPA